MDTLVIASSPPAKGTIRLVGRVHGAMNCVVTPADNPADWFFKQFISQEELDSFSRQHSLIIEGNNDASEQN